MYMNLLLRVLEEILGQSSKTIALVSLIKAIWTNSMLKVKKEYYFYKSFVNNIDKGNRNIIYSFKELLNIFKNK